MKLNFILTSIVLILIFQLSAKADKVYQLEGTVTGTNVREIADGPARTSYSYNDNGQSKVRVICSRNSDCCATVISDANTGKVTLITNEPVSEPPINPQGDINYDVFIDSTLHEVVIQCLNP